MMVKIEVSVDFFPTGIQHIKGTCDLMICKFQHVFFIMKIFLSQRPFWSPNSIVYHVFLMSYHFWHLIFGECWKSYGKHMKIPQNPGRFIAKALLMVWHWYRILRPPSHTGADPKRSVVRRTVPVRRRFVFVGGQWNVNGTSLEHQCNANGTW